MASLCTVVRTRTKQNKTEQNRNDEKYNQTGITVKIHTNHAGVRATAITLRSTAVSSSSDLRSSQWRKPQVLHQPLFEWKIKACSDILSHALSARPHQSLQPSVTALSSRAIFMFRWIRLLFIHKTLALNCLFSTCHVKTLRVFMSHNSAEFQCTFHFQILY